MAALIALLSLQCCLVGSGAIDLILPAASSNLAQRRTARHKHRPVFHITAYTGWLNGPTGFVKFRDQYHLFYLYHPYAGAWAHIGWAHAVSDTLLDWIHYQPALMPAQESYDKHGCLGGSALIHNDYLTLFYTGNVISNNRTTQNQNVAISSDGIVFQKYLYNPVIKEPPFKDGYFKNPKVWRYQNSWFMLVGAMSQNQQGQLLLYTSPDMFHWRLSGPIARSYGDMGYMWENPDLFELEDMHVLIFCARGIQTDEYRFKNLYQAGYLIGKFDHSIGQFIDAFEVSTDTYNLLDYGHDFYAPQTLLDSDGRRLLIGWLGMWDSRFQESWEGWAGLLTIVRELSINKNENDKLLMVPARELIGLRTGVLEDAWYSPGESFYAGSKSFELIVNSTEGANLVVISLEWEGGGHYTIEYNAPRGFVSVDRGGEDGFRRADWAPWNDFVHWRIFFDYSAIEVYCGRGEVVFSSRVYPWKGVNIKISGDTPLHMMQYSLRRSVRHDDYAHLQPPEKSRSQPDLE